MTVFGVSVRWLGPALCLLLGLSACTRPNLNYCDEAKPCGEGRTCKNYECEALGPDAGGRGGAGGGRGSGGSGGTGDVDTGVSTIEPTDGPMGTGDTGAPDAPVDAGGCQTDEQCPAGMKACVQGVCRACKSPAPGMPATLYCDQLTKPFCEDNQCKGCHEVTAPPSTPVCMTPTSKCNPATGLCAECLTSADCMEKTKPICGAGNKCVSCANNAECVAKNPAELACLTNTGACAVCGKNSDCPAATPACVMNAMNVNQCAPCTSDKECQDRGDGPGLCITDPDGKAGRCASEEETIYVGKTACADDGTGLTGRPFCSPQAAIGAVSGTRRVVVIRGPDSFFGMNVDKSGMPVHVIGVNGPTIAPGALPGIAVKNTDLRVRGLTIAGSAGLGVQAESSAIIRLNRCIIEDNRQGGLSIMAGAGFDVANSVFKGNGANGGATGAIGAAALVKPAVAARPSRFRTSTIVDNVNGGVTCFSSITLSGLLLRGNENNPGCTLVESHTMGDPLFAPAPPYHILESSPCRNKVSAGNAPSDDIDGQSRISSNGLTDCGADDWNP